MFVLKDFVTDSFVAQMPDIYARIPARRARTFTFWPWRISARRSNPEQNP